MCRSDFVPLYTTCEVCRDKMVYTSVGVCGECLALPTEERLKVARASYKRHLKRRVRKVLHLA